MRLYLLLLVIIGCGSQERPEASPTAIDEALVPHVQDFLSEAQKRNLEPDTTILIAIAIGTPEDLQGRMGVCRILSNGRRTILIKDIPQKFLQKVVVYHELFHCLYNLEHDEQDPIMSTYLPSEGYLRAYWPLLLETTFHKAIQSP